MTLLTVAQEAVTHSNYTEIIVAILASSAVSGIITNLLNRGKSKAETKSAEITAESAQVDLMQKVNDFYRKENEQLLKKLLDIEEKLDKVEKMLEDKELDNCQNVECPNRDTKRKEIELKSKRKTA